MEDTRSDKSAGRIVGVLYVTGTALGILSVALTTPVTGADNVIDAAVDHSTSLTAGALAILGMAVALALIPVIAFPVLSRVSAALARAHALLRGVVEFGSYLPVIAGLLLVANLGAYGGEESLAKSLVHQDALTSMTAVGFLGGATVFYIALWRGRLVPRWISGWGLVAVAPYLIGSTLTLFGAVDSMASVNVALLAPLGVQEMVLAVWLIVRGFASR
jgi:hypothetical protein